MSRLLKVNELRSQMHNNSHEIYIFSFEEMDKLLTGTNRARSNPTWLATWERIRNRYLKPEWNTKIVHKGTKYVAGYSMLAYDIHTLGLLLSDLGWIAARAYIKVYRGIPHIIVKGRSGLRKMVTASNYSLKGAKAVEMRLGKSGAMADAYEGGIVTFILLTSYRVLDCVMGDASIIQTVGRIGTDAVKVGVATGASMASAALISAGGEIAATSSVAFVAGAGGFLVAIGPLLAVVVVGGLAAYGLEELDEHYHLTKRLVAGLQELTTKGISEIKEEKKQMRGERKRLANQVDSVIDYATDKVEPVLIHALHRLPQWTAPVTYLSKVL